MEFGLSIPENSNMKTFKQLLEVLSSPQKSLVSSWARSDHTWSDHAFRDHPNRTRVPLEFPDHKSEHQSKVEDHLKFHGIHVHDYIGGFGTDKHGRQVSIGKALVKTKAEPHLVNGFANDPARQQLKAFKDYHVTVSKHPHDVAGMTSEGHSWENESCMNFSTGSNREYLKADVEEGTHVAYLTHKDDKDIETPLARIALKPFHDVDTGETILRPEHRLYGNAPDAFSHTVNRWVNKHFPGKEDGIYKKNEYVYDDTGSRTVIGSKSLDRAISHPDEDIRLAAAGHPNATVEHLNHALNDDSEFVRAEVFNNPKANSDHIEKGMKDANHFVHMAAIQHPSATKEQIHASLKNQMSAVRVSALLNPNVDVDHIDIGLRDSNPFVRSTAIKSTNATKDHIDRALKDYAYFVRANAVLNSNATKEHIDKALEDSNEDVQSSAMQNPNVTEKHLDAVLSNDNQRRRYSILVKASALKHPNATSKHVEMAMNHDNGWLRAKAMNSKATEEQLRRGLDDLNLQVENNAVEELKRRGLWNDDTGD